MTGVRIRRTAFSETSGQKRQQASRASFSGLLDRGIGVLFRHSAIVALVFSGFLVALAASHGAQAGGKKSAALVLDANTGAVLYSEDGDAPRHPASLTKMMTLYLTFETIESGRLSMSDRVVMSARAAGQAPSKLDMDAGDSLTVSQAIQALITKSANDVATALAEKIGGTEANFAKLMNKRAREIGMRNTHFENASGLPNDEQLTTARDMVTLGLRLQDDFPTYYTLFKTSAFTFQGKTYRNHNTLLRTYQGIDGIKTGYTRASGFNLVSSVRRGNRHVVAAVFGGASAAKRNAEMRRLLSRGLARASTERTRKPRPMLVAKLKTPPRLAQRPRPAVQPAKLAMAAPQYAEARQPQALRPSLPVVEQAAPPLQSLANETPPPVADAGPPIDVFKVKRVLVAPRPASPLDETTDMEARDPGDADGLPPPRSAPAFYQVASAPERETVIAKTAPGVGRLPSSLGRQMAMLGGHDAIAAQLEKQQREAEAARAAAPVAAAATGSVAAETAAPVLATEPAYDPPAPQRGRRPSSLQAQAVRLDAPRPAPVTHQVAALQPASNRAAAAAASRYEIQIGAYHTIDDAQTALRATQSKAGRLLAGFGSVTHPVMIGGKQIYRARFSGFDANRAADTCTELRRQSIDCFVMTAE